MAKEEKHKRLSSDKNKKKTKNSSKKHIPYEEKEGFGGFPEDLDLKKGLRCGG